MVHLTLSEMIGRKTALGAVVVSTVLAQTRGALTSTQETAIVDKHNTLRGAVSAPCTAADMEKLVWDASLASAAQTYADKCVGDHDPALKSMGGSVAHGENLFMQFPGTDFTTNQLLDKGVQGWYNEIKDTEWTLSSKGLKSKTYSDTSKCVAPDAANNACFIGHFTQVVWAKSNKIGCAVKQCASGLSIGGTSYASGVILVCRYTPMGNSADKTNGMDIPYMYGSKCAACADGCANGLCAGVTPNRCKDDVPFKVNSDNFNTCADAVKKYSNWCSALDKGMGEPCKKHCGTCKAPPSMGSEFCGSDSSGNSSSKTKKMSALVNGARWFAPLNHILLLSILPSLAALIS